MLLEVPPLTTSPLTAAFCRDSGLDRGSWITGWKAAWSKRLKQIISTKDSLD